MLELNPEAYTVLWIAPLDIEVRAALLMFDSQHEGQFSSLNRGDHLYHAGSICGHNVIIATFPPSEVYGNTSAAKLVTQVKCFFPNIRFGLLVGVAAGIPALYGDNPLDIRLGDVLVALPDGETPALVAYDRGKETKDGYRLLRSGHGLPITESIVSSAMGKIKHQSPNDTKVFLPYYEDINHPAYDDKFTDPGQEKDKFYDIDRNGRSYLVEREVRPLSKRTRVWYGPIGTGDTLMKNSQKRNELRNNYRIIGLEMEAAGVMPCIPAGVIRGVCDYGSEEKNKDWQPYAAAMAAAYAKAILHEIAPSHRQTSHCSVPETKHLQVSQGSVSETSHGNTKRTLPFLYKR
ncbi:hypothetical protein AA313_de0205807 [Arthrobotrys entomopaga]|nr:hypothetical protein AA313_de0205807 [Arthrobotrys entomopaga]